MKPTLPEPDFHQATIYGYSHGYSAETVQSLIDEAYKAGLADANVSEPAANLSEHNAELERELEGARVDAERWRTHWKDVDTLRTAVSEMSHAIMNPNWYTNGQRGAMDFFICWRGRGFEASARLTHAIDAMKEKP